MTMYSIPIPDELLSWDYDIDLSGIVYNLDFHWNDRAETWTMNINDKDKNPLVCGIPLLLGQYLTQQYKYIAGFPQGDFYLHSDIENEEAKIDDLGVKAFLIYIENE